MNIALRVLGVSSLALSLAGCQFYSVSDADTQKAYITHNWACKKDKKKGTVRFIDLKTRQEMKLNYGRIDPIPADEALAEVAAATSTHR